MIDARQMTYVRAWTMRNMDTLQSLYDDFQNDTGDTETTFPAFCLHMFKECRHDQEAS